MRREGELTMPAAGSLVSAAAHGRADVHVTEPFWLRGLLIALALVFLCLFLRRAAAVGL